MANLFECHITIDPVEENERNKIQLIAKERGFRLAKLLMQKGSPSKLDTFMTSHDMNYHALVWRMTLLCRELQEAGYIIRRYKIEEIVLDSRVDDVCELLRLNPNGN